MLKSDYHIEPTELDLIIFEKLVPADHYLRQVKAIIDFEFVLPAVRECYSETMGRSGIDPVRLFKLEFLMFQYDLSDREVMAAAQVNVAYRYFLDLSLDNTLPVPSLLSQFRKRLGKERYQRLFDGIVAQARERGLVKDRLRLKDATHVIANIAIPATIRLVAQVREKLLESLQPYEPTAVQAAVAEADRIRRSTVDLKDEQRLQQRVEQLRRLVTWADQVQAALGSASEADRQRERLDQALETAHKLLADQDDPQGPDRLRSAVDPEARRGKHGHYFDGYNCDLCQDADSEIITALNILPGNGDEAADASTLIEREQAAHHNQVAALSIDSIGFQGPVLRELSRPDGLALTVYVPPHSQGIAETDYFKPTDFQLEAEGTILRCPHGAETSSRHRNGKDSAWVFNFKRVQCAGCPLLDRCMAKLPANHGRSVSCNDYQAEYDAARQLAQTPAYAQVRREHPKIERKLAEIVRYHGGRRARYRGRARVKIQFLLIGLVVNIKRIVHLVTSRERSPLAQPA